MPGVQHAYMYVSTYVHPLYVCTYIHPFVLCCIGSGSWRYEEWSSTGSGIRCERSCNNESHLHRFCTPCSVLFWPSTSVFLYVQPCHHLLPLPLSNQSLPLIFLLSERYLTALSWPDHRSVIRAGGRAGGWRGMDPAARKDQSPAHPT